MAPLSLVVSSFSLLLLRFYSLADPEKLLMAWYNLERLPYFFTLFYLELGGAMIVGI